MVDQSFASSIPLEMVTSMQREIARYQAVNKDGYQARRYLTVRNVASTVDKDTVRTIEGGGGNSTIHAKITAKGALPETVGTKVKETDFPIFWLADSFNINEKDLAKDPRIQNRNVAWASLQIQRLENYTAINGDAASNITGVVTAARANSLGKITAAATSGSNVGNQGAWDGSETDALMDPYEDLRAANMKISAEYGRSTRFLCGNPTDIGYLWQMNEERGTYIDEIAKLFGRQPQDTSYIVESDYFTAGYVYIIAKDMNAAEMIIAEDLNVDTNYPRQPGKNHYVEVGEWLNPIAVYDNKGFVEVQVT